MSLENLNKMIQYDPTTGNLYRLVRMGKAPIGIIEKKNNHDGYCRIKVFGKMYLHHRLCWFLFYGEWPKNGLDHINGDMLDNRISNLRDVTHRENCTNRIEHRNGATAGVFLDNTTNKFRSSIQYKGKRIEFGLFNNKDEAYNKYLQFKLLHNL